MSNEDHEPGHYEEKEFLDRLIIPKDQLPTGREEEAKVFEDVAAASEPEFVTKQAIPRFVKVTSKVKPEPTIKVDGVTLPSNSSDAAGELSILNARIKEAEEAIKLLTAGRDGIKLRATAVQRKAVDWTKLKEEDIFDLNVPIDIIDHDMPDYMRVEPVDSNYVLRWVQKMPRRLGPMKAKGFQFATQADIKGELNIAMEVDANERISFDDVYLMIIQKSLYYGMLRKNHERSLRMVNPKMVHKEAAERVMNDIRNNVSTDGVKSDYVPTTVTDQYTNSADGKKPKLHTYIPGEI